MECIQMDKEIKLLQLDRHILYILVNHAVIVQQIYENGILFLTFNSILQAYNYFTILQDCTPIYPQNGGEILAAETGLELLSKIPIDPNLVRCGESGENFIQKFNNSDTAQVFQELQSKILKKMEPISE